MTIGEQEFCRLVFYNRIQSFMEPFGVFPVIFGEAGLLLLFLIADLSIVVFFGLLSRTGDISHFLF